MDRRRFLALTGLTAAQALALGCRAARPPRVRGTARRAAPMGPLVPDPAGFLDLPAGFTYTVLSRAGDPMTDGLPTPPIPDGMTCHEGPDGTWILLRNHELAPGRPSHAWLPADAPLDRAKAFDRETPGGVTKLVVGREDLDVRAAFLVLSGTHTNCSGGHVAEGWVSCEETHDAGHGWAFLCRKDAQGLESPRRLGSWGRFQREGIALDRAAGVVWMTEDHADGCFYRFVADDPSDPYGDGRVEALRPVGLADTNGTEAVPGRAWPVTWVPVADPSAARARCLDQAREAGAARFVRVEGLVWDGTHVWFVASTAGPVGAGQLWRLTPGTDGAADRLSLVSHVTDRRVLSMPDNLTLAPWGDLVAAEDNYDSRGGCTHNHLRGLSPDGHAYDLARNPANGGRLTRAGLAPGAEFAGPCFSPDGSTLFVNLQDPVSATVAIRGPWPTSA